MEIDSYWGRISEPLEYRVGTLWKLACFGFAVFMGISSPLFVSGPAFQRGPIFGFAMAGSCLVISVFCALYAVRGLIRITSERIEYRWVFMRSMRRDEVVGKKRGHTSKGREFYRLVSNSGRLMLIDDGTFNVDDRFYTWLESIPTIEPPKKLAMRYKGF